MDQYKILENCQLPLPKLTFCPKWEVSVNAVLEEG